MKTSLLDLGDIFTTEIMPDRSISQAERDLTWAIYNVSLGLGSEYSTMANAVYAAMKGLKNESCIAWTKAHVAYLLERQYSPKLPLLQARWEAIQVWAA